MAFDLPTNSTTLTELFVYANKITGFHFGWVILFAWFVISLVISTQRFDNKSALIIASFTTTIFAIFFRVIGIVNELTMYVCIITTIVAIGIAGRR